MKNKPQKTITPANQTVTTCEVKGCRNKPVELINDPIDGVYGFCKKHGIKSKSNQLNTMFSMRVNKDKLKKAKKRAAGKLSKILQQKIDEIGNS